MYFMVRNSSVNNAWTFGLQMNIENAKVHLVEVGQKMSQEIDDVWSRMHRLEPGSSIKFGV